MRGCNSEGNPTNYALRLKVLKIKERYYFTCILEYVGVKEVGSLLNSHISSGTSNLCVYTLILLIFTIKYLSHYIVNISGL